MDERMQSQDVISAISQARESTIFTAVALEKLFDDHNFRVQRWLSYVVPKPNLWTPWPDEQLDYDYGAWRFLHFKQSSTEFLAMLKAWTSTQDREYELLSGIRARLPLSDDYWNRWRTWSHQPRQYRIIPYPSTWYVPSNAQNDSASRRTHDFVAPKLPFFPSAKEAFATLIDGVDIRTLTNRNLEGQPYGIFVINETPSIEKVSLYLDRCEVKIHGTRIGGCELKVFADSGTIESIPLFRSGIHNVGWAGLPQYAEIALTRGHELLDNVIYSRHPIFGVNRNVDVILGQDSALEALVQAGEGQDIEFKENLPIGKKDEEFLETICAFANTNDGVIIVGVSDRGEIHGLGHTLTEKWEESLSNKIRNNLDPVPSFRIERQLYNDSWIVLIHVSKGSGVFALNSTSAPVFYRRHGSNDFPAKLSELTAMFTGQA